MQHIDLDIVLQAMGLIGPAIGWLYQVSRKLQRDKIKTDLEILEKSKQFFGDLDERTKRVDAKITLIMGYIYRDSVGGSPKPIAWGEIALFITCAAGAIEFGWSGSLPNAYWEYVLAGLLAFVGLGALINALDEKRARGGGA